MARAPFAVRVYEPEPGRPCTVCAGYPRGWESDVVLRGHITLCEPHRESVRLRIERVPSPETPEEAAE